jgi:hypothetical protein
MIGGQGAVTPAGALQNTGRHVVQSALPCFTGTRRIDAEARSFDHGRMCVEPSRRKKLREDAFLHGSADGRQRAARSRSPHQHPIGENIRWLPVEFIELAAVGSGGLPGGLVCKDERWQAVLLIEKRCVLG